MNTNKTTQQKYVNAIEALFNGNHFKSFHYTISQLIYEQFKISRATTRSLVKLDILDKLDKGYLKFKCKPTREDCIKVYNDVKTQVREYQRMKSAEKNKNTDTIVEKKEPVSKRKLIPISEDACIAYLKERGYKIMKQVIEFKEL